MPKLSTLIETANLQVDDTYDNLQYYKWFQEMLDDIAPKFFNPKKVIIPRDPITGAYNIPSGFKSVVTLQANNQVLSRVGIGSINSVGFYIMGREIYITGSSPTSITLFYDSNPSRLVESPDHVPDIPERFHYMFVTFACKQAMLLEDEVAYEERYRAYLGEYEKAKKQLEEESNREKGTALLNSAARWTVVR
jgi:hypothetical protein